MSVERSNLQQTRVEDCNQESSERFDPDLGKLSEVSDDEVERGIPTWAAKINRYDDGLALASMRSALSGVDKKTDR